MSSRERARAMAGRLPLSAAAVSNCSVSRRPSFIAYRCRPPPLFDDRRTPRGLLLHGLADRRLRKRLGLLRQHNGLIEVLVGGGLLSLLQGFFGHGPAGM